jgi:hypothetical protein
LSVYLCFCPSVQFLDFSQQLCERLEQLVLTYASFDFLSLEETDPARYCTYQKRLVGGTIGGRAHYNVWNGVDVFDTVSFISFQPLQFLPLQ